MTTRASASSFSAPRPKPKKTLKPFAKKVALENRLRASVSFKKARIGFSGKRVAIKERPVNPEWLIKKVKSIVEEYLSELAPGLISSELGKSRLFPDEAIPNANALLSVAEFASRLGVSDQTVRNRENENEVFSLLGPARKRGREYPAFQLMNGIQGAPLKRVLGELKDIGNADKFQFFTAPNYLLGDVTPIRVLVAQGQGTIGSRRAVGLLQQSPEARLEVVAKAARTFVATLAAS